MKSIQEYEKALEEEEIQPHPHRPDHRKKM
jgi:hypothetical protein